MIIVKHVDIVEVPSARVAELVCMPDYAMEIKTAEEQDFRNYYMSETIKPQNFVNYRGETVRIGCSKQAQDVLGIVMDSFNNMKKENQRLFDTSRKLSNSLNRVRNAGFFKRFVYLFTGVK